MNNPKGQETLDWAARFKRLEQQARHPLLQRFYQQGVIDAGTALEQVELLAMDLETTGLNARTDSIVSIACCRSPSGAYAAVKPCTG